MELIYVDLIVVWVVAIVLVVLAVWPDRVRCHQESCRELALEGDGSVDRSSGERRSRGGEFSDWVTTSTVPAS